MSCSVSGDTLQCSLKEGVFHWRTWHVTQVFTYLLTQRRAAATPTSVCLLFNHDSARRLRWPSTITKNLGRYLSCTQLAAQGKDFELILAVKMETENPVEGPFGREFPAICNHCRVMTAWSRKTLKVCEQFLHFFKTILMKLPLLCGLHPKSVSASPPHLAYTLPDFIQIDSLSAELLPNVWIPFCPVEYLQYRLFVPIIIGIVPRGKKMFKFVSSPVGL